MTLYLSSAAETPQSVQATAAADGIGYDFAIPVDVSEALAPGAARYAIKAVSADGTQVTTCAYGDVLIKPDAATAADRRSVNEINLAAVEAGITARMQGTIMNEYVLSGTSVKMPALPELLEIRATLKRLIAQEKGKACMRSIPVRLKSAHGVVPFGMYPSRRPRW